MSKSWREARPHRAHPAAGSLEKVLERLRKQEEQQEIEELLSAPQESHEPRASQ